MENKDIPIEELLQDLIDAIKLEPIKPTIKTVSMMKTEIITYISELKQKVEELTEKLQNEKLYCTGDMLSYGECTPTEAILKALLQQEGLKEEVR
jgi:hypothetical protein